MANLVKSSIDKTSRLIQVEHMTIRCKSSAEEVHDRLVSTVPKVEQRLFDILIGADKAAIEKERGSGRKLWLFHIINHGELLAADNKKTVAYQYLIGNPLIAETMTRHCIAAALYAPLRLALYQCDDGSSSFEYDRPSTLFGQFNIPEVTEVGKMLDEELEKLLDGLR